MDLRQLAALTAVADTGTFSAAADVLHTVQSNVSTHVARLERELGATLVDRSAGRLTEEGEVVVARARRIAAELDALAADVASLRDEVAGHVRLGVIGTTGRWLMPPLLTAMGVTHPKVEVAVLEGNTTSLLPQLASGAVDLAVVNLPVDDPDIAVEPIFEEDLIVVAPTSHPLAALDVADIADLASHELLLTPPGNSIRTELDKAAAAAGVELKAKAELDGLRLIASLTFEGFGAAVLPASAVPRWLTGEWRRIPITGLGRRQVGVARRRRGLLSAPARALQEVLAEVVTEQSKIQPGLDPLTDR
ncbi:MAG TPA: LysR family transcriptional regulator [Acidimicrobiales bacterium]|nr:LysR family transcriptional regulator [Acidimicrobiales bacterium]